MLLIVFSLLIAISAVIFAMQNPGSIEIKFLASQFEGSLALVLLVTFACGFISCALMALAALIQGKILKVLTKKVGGEDAVSPAAQSKTPSN